MENTKRVFKISDDAVAFVFSISQWGNRRVANLGDVATDADKSMLHLTKTLIDSDEYKAIGRWMNETKGWLMARSVPSFFRDGCYLFRLSMVADVEKHLRFAETIKRGLVDKLLEVYPAQIETARERLAGQFNVGDYPTIEELRRAFFWSYQWIAFGIPEGLPPEIRQQEMEKAKNMWEEAAQSITIALRESFNGLIRHAREKLQPGEDGKPRIFRDTLVTNIKDFLETFQARNIVGDDELAALVAKAQAVIGGVDKAQALRDDQALRDSVKDGFEAIEKEMETLVERKRAFDL